MKKGTCKIRICITLDKNVMNLSKKKIEPAGGKLATLIENLLVKFNSGEVKL